MKKYSVYALLKNGQDIQFETDTNIKVAMPVMIDGHRICNTYKSDEVYIEEENTSKQLALF